MKYSIALLVVALFVVGSHADPHSHYVEHTDPCTSQCQYYGQACPIYTLIITGPGYDCNRGYCRLSAGGECVAVPRNAYYVENTDACGSLCMYTEGCPIRPIGPTPPGFNCEKGYCRRTWNSKCKRAKIVNNKF